MNKTELIEVIKGRIEECGSFTVGDVYADTSPLVNSISEDVLQLAEHFYHDKITTVIYANDREVATQELPYEQLTESTLQEIWELAQQWKG